MKKLTALLCLVLILLLSGCSALSLNESSIMCPPKATGNKADIQKLIDKQTSGDYVLKYPKNGSNRSSIVMHDLDHDDDEDAIAFYSDKSGEHIHALFVECKNSDYVIIEDVLIEAATIDRIEFCDLNADSKCEIILGYSRSTSSQNVMSIFTYNKDASPVITQNETPYTYSSLVTGDFDKDKSDDILLISLYSGDIAARAQLLVFSGTELVEVSSAELDSDITQLASATYGQISDDSYGAILDGVSSTGDYTTQVVLFDSSRPALINPLFSYSGYSLTRRSTQICSTDYNKDSLIDIPICSLMLHNEDDDVNTIARRIDWNNLDTDTYTLNTSQSAIFCSADGYLLTMPQKWSESVTARYDKTNRELSIYTCEYSGSKLVLKDKLITVKAYFDENYEKSSSEYTEFMRVGATVYTYLIGSADNYLSITGDELSSLFKPVNL